MVITAFITIKLAQTGDPLKLKIWAINVAELCRTFGPSSHGRSIRPTYESLGSNVQPRFVASMAKDFLNSLKALPCLSEERYFGSTTIKE